MENDDKRSGLARALCIVLRSVPYAEADCILTLFSREDGLIDARAYGARSIRSKIRSACQPFCVAEFEFYLKNGYRSVKAADVRNEFFALQSSFVKYGAGCVILELTERILRGAGPDDYERLFRLTAHSLAMLSDGGTAAEPALLYFMMRAVDELGIFPSLSTCSVCGERNEGSDLWSASEGGIVCQRCAGERSLRRLDHQTLKCLRTFGRGRCLTAQDSLFDTETFTASIRIMEEMLANQMGIFLRSMRLVRN